LFILTVENGNIVIQNIQSTPGCANISSSSTNPIYGGVFSNANNVPTAMYEITEISQPQNFLNIGYVDKDSYLHPYPKSMLEYSNNYISMNGFDSSNNDITTLSNISLETCNQTCNTTNNCVGTEFDLNTETCWLKNNIGVPTITTNNLTLNIRKPKINSSLVKPNCSTTSMIDIDTVKYQNYAKQTNMTSDTSCFKFSTKELKQNNKKLNDLAKQVDTTNNSVNNNIQNINNSIIQNNKTYNTMKPNILEGFVGLDKKYTSLQLIENKLNDINGMFNDSNLLVKQENYLYIFWLILAIVLIIIAVKIKK
jgi:uncharacterized protein YfcZ (UPF0381/DUF406 family)